jgi:hypothetical protein
MPRKRKSPLEINSLLPVPEGTPPPLTADAPDPSPVQIEIQNVRAAPLTVQAVPLTGTLVEDAVCLLCRSSLHYTDTGQRSCPFHGIRKENNPPHADHAEQADHAEE